MATYKAYRYTNGQWTFMATPQHNRSGQWLTAKKIFRFNGTSQTWSLVWVKIFDVVFDGWYVSPNVLQSAINQGWNQTDPLRITFKDSCVCYSANTANPGIDFSGIPSDAMIYINNGVLFLGMGGEGGYIASNNQPQVGSDGGPAVLCNTNLTFNVLSANVNLAGGGGGGGAYIADAWISTGNGWLAAGGGGGAGGGKGGGIYCYGSSFVGGAGGAMGAGGANGIFDRVYHVHYAATGGGGGRAFSAIANQTTNSTSGGNDGFGVVGAGADGGGGGPGVIVYDIGASVLYACASYASTSFQAAQPSYSTVNGGTVQPGNGTQAAGGAGGAWGMPGNACNVQNSGMGGRWNIPGAAGASVRCVGGANEPVYVGFVPHKYGPVIKS
jgi:hypothetical protein